MGPLQIRGLIMFLPKFVRVFYRLMKDPRVSIFAKAVPFVILFHVHFAPRIELDFVPVMGELDWILAGYIALKLSVGMPSRGGA